MFREFSKLAARAAGRAAIVPVFTMLLASAPYVKSYAARTDDTATGRGTRSMPPLTPAIPLPKIPSAMRTTRTTASSEGGNMVTTKAEGQYVQWNQCEGNVQGSHSAGPDAAKKPSSSAKRSGAQCNLKMHKDLAEAMDKALMDCLKKATGKEVTSIHIHHAGCYANRNKRTPSDPQGKKNSKSLHATARAIDIYGIEIKPSGEKISFDKKDAGKNQDVYKKLRACWKEKIENELYHLCSPSNGGSIGYEGSGEPANQLHNDHLHLECGPPAGKTDIPPNNTG